MYYPHFRSGPLPKGYLNRLRSPYRAIKPETRHIFGTRTSKRVSFPNCILFERLSERAVAAWKAYGSPPALGFRMGQFPSEGRMNAWQCIDLHQKLRSRTDIVMFIVLIHGISNYTIFL